jgi:K+-transporting ATPase ATPase C chain
MSADLRDPSLTPVRDNTLAHVVTSAIYTVITVLALGIIYPVVMWGIGSIAFPQQAGGSILSDKGTPIGSELVGQLFKKPQYFHGRPSAAGNGYDPTQTGGTNLGPTSKKLIDATRATIAAVKKENPDAAGPVPVDLVTSSASGIDPDISPDGAAYQIARVAKARGMSVEAVRAIVNAHIIPRQFGIFGEPRVNVLDLNRALDAAGTAAK